MNFEKMRAKHNFGLDDFILSQPCGYISHLSENGNYSAIKPSSTYTPSNNGEFCNHKCNVCVHKDDVYTACSNIRKIRQEQFNEPKIKFVEIKGQPYLKIPDKTVEMLKTITDEHLLYVAQAVVNEMEARGYGSKKN